MLYSVQTSELTCMTFSMADNLYKSSGHLACMIIKLLHFPSYRKGFLIVNRDMDVNSLSAVVADYIISTQLI